MPHQKRAMRISYQRGLFRVSSSFIAMQRNARDILKWSSRQARPRRGDARASDCRSRFERRRAAAGEIDARNWSKGKRQGSAHIHNGRVFVRPCVNRRRDGGRGRLRSAALTIGSRHRPAYDTGEGAAAAHGEYSVGEGKEIRRGARPYELGRREGCRWWCRRWCGVRLRMLFWALITPGRPLSAST
jgi:hypothetical protein